MLVIVLIPGAAVSTVNVLELAVPVVAFPALSVIMALNVISSPSEYPERAAIFALVTDITTSAPLSPVTIL